MNYIDLGISPYPDEPTRTGPLPQIREVSSRPTEKLQPPQAPSIFNFSEVAASLPGELAGKTEYFFPIVLDSEIQIFPSAESQENLGNIFSTDSNGVQYRVTQLVTHLVWNETVSYNPIRRNRRQQQVLNGGGYEQALSDNPTHKCPFCSGENGGKIDKQPYDPFGQVRHGGALTITNPGSDNTPMQSLVVIPELHDHNGLSIKRIDDMLLAADEWTEKAHRYNPGRIFPVVDWNLGAKAGASQFHPHLKIGMEWDITPHEKDIVKGMADRKLGTRKPYMEEFVEVMEAMGLARYVGDAAIVHNPVGIKDHELVVVSMDNRGLKNPDFRRAVGIAIMMERNLFDQGHLNMFSFLTPMGNAGQEGRFHDYRPYFRIIGRGGYDGVQTNIFK